MALAAQHDLQEFAHRPLVVDDQDAPGAALDRSRGAVRHVAAHAAAAARAGRRTSTVVPPPGFDATRISPP